jgi:hypothetical protein
VALRPRVPPREVPPCLLVEVLHIMPQHVLPGVVPCVLDASASLSVCGVGVSRRLLLPLVLVPGHPTSAWRASGLARSTPKGGAHPNW